MAALTFTVTASQTEFDDFANRLGYMDTITTGFDGQGMPITAPNPESRADFLQRVMKELVASKFYAPFIADIDREVRDQREVDKEIMRNVVRDRVAVSFTA